MPPQPVHALAPPQHENQHLPADGISESRTFAPPAFQLQASPDAPPPTAGPGHEHSGIAHRPLQMKSAPGDVMQLKPTVTNSYDQMHDMSDTAGAIMGHSFGKLQKMERALRSAYGVKVKSGAPVPGSPNLAIPQIRVMVKNNSGKTAQVVANIKSKDNGDFLVFKSTGDQKLVKKGASGQTEVMRAHTPDATFSPVGAYSFFDPSKDVSYAAHKAEYDGDYMKMMGVKGDHQKFHHSEQAIYKLLLEQPELAFDALDNALPKGQYVIEGMSLDIFTTRAACKNCGDSAEKVLSDDNHFFKKFKGLIGTKKSAKGSVFALDHNYVDMIRFGADFGHDTTNSLNDYSSNPHILHGPAMGKNDIVDHAGGQIFEVDALANVNYSNAPTSSPPSPYSAYTKNATNGVSAKHITEITAGLARMGDKTAEERFLYAAFGAKKCIKKATKTQLNNGSDLRMNYLYQQRHVIGCTDHQLMVWCMKHYKVIGSSPSAARNHMAKYLGGQSAFRFKSNKEARVDRAIKGLDHEVDVDMKISFRSWLIESPSKINDAKTFADARNKRSVVVEAVKEFLREAGEISLSVIVGHKPDDEQLRIMRHALELPNPEKLQSDQQNEEDSVFAMMGATENWNGYRQNIQEALQMLTQSQNSPQTNPISIGSNTNNNDHNHNHSDNQDDSKHDGNGGLSLGHGHHSHFVPMHQYGGPQYQQHYDQHQHQHQHSNTHSNTNNSNHNKPHHKQQQKTFVDSSQYNGNTYNNSSQFNPSQSMNYGGPGYGGMQQYPPPPMYRPHVPIANGMPMLPVYAQGMNQQNDTGLNNNKLKSPPLPPPQYTHSNNSNNRNQNDDQNATGKHSYTGQHETTNSVSNVRHNMIGNGNQELNAKQKQKYAEVFLQLSPFFTEQQIKVAVRAGMHEVANLLNKALELEEERKKKQMQAEQNDGNNKNNKQNNNDDNNNDDNNNDDNNNDDNNGNGGPSFMNFLPNLFG